ncbi:hypothetical protein ACHAPU_004667 [Fusarium lateritium]
MATNSLDYTRPVEQLFLDISLNDVITRRMPFVEPWATIYVDAVLEQRFGDAVWARYHMEGGAENGVIHEWPNPSITVLESLKEDVVEAKTNEPSFYEQAVAFYSKTSSSDGHPEVIEVIFKAEEQGEKEEDLRSGEST